MIKGCYKHIDIQQLNEMADGDNQFISDLINLFLNQVPAFSSQLEANLNQSDFYAMGKLAHKIKGSAAMVGVTSLVGLMRELQDQAQHDKPSEQCAIIIERFKATSALAIDELRGILNDFK